LDKAVELLQQWGSKLAELAQQVGPEIAQVAMTAIAVQYIGQLVIGAVLVLLGIGILIAAYRSAKRAYADSCLPYREQSEGLQVCLWTGSGIGAFAALCMIGSGIFDKLLDPWAWAALYDPRLIVAKKVFGLD
jgi:MFS family permease